jgi:hypothetical protein
MKKVLFPGLLGLLLTTVTISQASAQSTALLQPGSFDPKAGTTTSLNTNRPNPAANALPLNSVSAKTIRTFNDYFKGASDLQWYRGEKNKFLAIFTSKDGRISRALIDKTGYLYYGINYGNEESLSYEQLQDENTIVKVRLTEDGSIDELEHNYKNLHTRKTRKARQ